MSEANPVNVLKSRETLDGKSKNGKVAEIGLANVLGDTELLWLNTCKCQIGFDNGFPCGANFFA